jgi:hypothetical protein
MMIGIGEMAREYSIKDMAGTAGSIEAPAGRPAVHPLT